MVNNTNKDINEKRNYVVYKHTSPSGKIYIGITGKNPPEKRWGVNGSNYRGYFGSAISKYGWDNFKHEILLTNLTQEEAEQKEIELISFYESTNRKYGYNICYGGLGGNAKMPILQYSKDLEFIRRWDGAIDAAEEVGISASCIAACCRDNIGSAGGFIWRYEFPDLVKKDVKGHTNPDTYKPVDQYFENGEFIATYKHITEAKSKTDVDDSMITKCCNNHQRKAGGFIWRYHGDELTQEYIKWCNGTGREDARVPVIQYSSDGDFIKKWDYINAIKKELGFDISAIIRCCKHEQAMSYGYIWRYLDDELTEEDIKWCNEKSSNSRGASKPVIQYTLSWEFVNKFKGAVEANRQTGIDASGIGKSCRSPKDKIKTAGGYIWRYADEC